MSPYNRRVIEKIAIDKIYSVLVPNSSSFLIQIDYEPCDNDNIRSLTLECPFAEQILQVFLNN